jgi:hypothetical protein
MVTSDGCSRDQIYNSPDKDSRRPSPRVKYFVQQIFVILTQESQLYNLYKTYPDFLLFFAFSVSVCLTA